MLKLIIEDDEGRKTVVPFVRDEITIGRQEGNTIRLTERNVSRRHAKLMRQNGHVLVEDLGSYNGIRINGDRIAGQVTVHDGDLIQIGDYDLAVQREEVAQAGGPQTPTTAPLPHLEETIARNHARLSQQSASMNETIPVLPTVNGPGDTADDDADEPDEADPADVQAAPAPASAAAEEAARRQSTAIIRMDQVESSRREVRDLDISEAPRLVVLNTEFAGREFACIRTELRVGRTDDNDIAIDHRSLSRTHCKVVREDNGEWRVIDLQSANGLLVNGDPYAQAALRSGDVLELGHVKLKFVGPGETFAVKATADGVTVRQGGSRLPLVAAGLAALVVMVGVAWAVLRPRPVAGGNAVQGPDRTAPPRELAVDADAAKKQVEGRLAEAKAKIALLDFKGARALLEACTLGEGQAPVPEAQSLLTKLKEEEGYRTALLEAEKAIAAERAEEANQKLAEAAATELLTAKLASLKERAAALKPAKAVEPPPKEVAVKPEEPKAVQVQKPVAPDPAAKATALMAEARELKKADQLRAAKKKIDECRAVAPGNVDCVLLSGIIYATLAAKESDNSVPLTNQARSFYQAFFKAACPGDRRCKDVEKILK